MSLRIVFMGTPDFAVPVLAEIIGHGHQVVAVYTRPPARAGRGMALKPSPVQALAEKFALPVYTPKTLRDPAALATLAAHDADVAVVVAYGLILPRAALDAPRHGCLNLHASLLPRWRGAAPIQRAIMAGDTQTGVMVMRMEEGLDTGPVAMAERVTIGANETAGELATRLAPLGADLMARALAALSRDALSFTPQAASGETYARKIGNDEAAIDFTCDAQLVHDHIRGLTPFPGAFVTVDLGRGPERLKVLRAERVDASGPAGTVLDDALTVACASGAVRLAQVQRAGGKPMQAAEFLRGVSLRIGDPLQAV